MFYKTNLAISSPYFAADCLTCRVQVKSDQTPTSESNLVSKLVTGKVYTKHFEALHGVWVGEEDVFHLVGNVPDLAFLHLLNPDQTSEFNVD